MSWELQRTFTLKVFLSEWEGFQASGAEIFICRPDEDDEWYVWKWFDQSETKEQMTWGDTKKQFM